MFLPKIQWIPKNNPLPVKKRRWLNEEEFPEVVWKEERGRLSSWQIRGSCKSNPGLFHPFHIYRGRLDINITLADRCWPRCTILLVLAAYPWCVTRVRNRPKRRHFQSRPPSTIYLHVSRAVSPNRPFRHYANIMRRWNWPRLINY